MAVTVSEIIDGSTMARSRIISLALEGTSIRKISKLVNISLSNLYKALAEDPLFRKEWDSARKDGADALADDSIDAFEGAETVADAMIAKGLSDALARSVAWRNPSRYSPKMQLEVTHSVDLSKALQQAEQRTLPIIEQASIDRAAQAALSVESTRLPTVLDAVQELPPVDKVAHAPSQSPQVYYNRDGSIKPCGPSGKPTGRPIGSLNRRKEPDPVVDTSDRPGIRDMARRRAERDYVLDAEISTPMSDPDFESFL